MARTSGTKKRFLKHLNDAVGHNQANDEKKSVHVTYQKLNGRTVKRKVSPISVREAHFTAYDHKRQAVRSYRLERIRDMKKVAFWDGFEKAAQAGVDPVSAGTLGSVVSGYYSGRSAAGTTSNALSRKGHKTKNEETARNIAKLTAPLGAVAGLALTLKHKGKLMGLAKKHISSHADMHQVYDAGIPFVGGTAGGMAAGALTGGATALRGAFSKKKEDKK